MTTGKTSQFYRREGKCSKCGECCRVLKVKVKERMTGDLWKYFETRGVRVERAPRWTILTFPNFPCPHLGPDNLCKIYENRPFICAVHPTAVWHLTPSCSYKILRDSG